MNWRVNSRFPTLDYISVPTTTKNDGKNKYSWSISNSNPSIQILCLISKKFWGLWGLYLNIFILFSDTISDQRCSKTNKCYGGKCLRQQKFNLISFILPFYIISCIHICRTLHTLSFVDIFYAVSLFLRYL